MNGSRLPALRITAPAQQLRHRYGLVLAGGAAKGAYQVGAVECLADHNLQVSAIAGTSIGALNGVVLACAPTLRDGADRLVRLWTEFTSAVAAVPFGQGTALGEDTIDRSLNLLPRLLRMLMARGLLERLVDEVVDEGALRSGTPMRVAAFPVLPPHPLPLDAVVNQVAEWAAGHFGARRSQILHLNGRSHDEIKRAVLGSAALPLVFRAQSVEGRFYRDGFLGKDNTPIRALTDVDGCDIIIIIHLDAGDTVKPVEHPGLTLLQIRPIFPLAPPGALGEISAKGDFSPAAFQRLRQRGYADAEATLGRYAAVLGTAKRLREAERFMADGVQRVLDNRRHMRPAARDVHMDLDGTC